MRRMVAMVTAGLLVAGGALVAWRFSGPKLLRFPTLAGPSSSATPGFQVREVSMEPGVSLRVATRAPTSADATWLVFFPGNDEKQLEQGVKLLARIAGDADVGLATFAYRGFDGSGGELDAVKADADALRVLDALKLEPSRTVFVGFSLGGPVASRAAAAWSRGGRAPKKLVLLAAASELAMVPQVAWAKLSRGEVFEVGDALSAVTCPVEVFHGAADTTLPSSMAETLATRAKVKATVLPGLDHVGLLEHVEFTW